MYVTDQWEPLLHVSVQDIEKRWAEVGEALLPRFLQNPEFRGFTPDYGLAMLKAGFKRETIQIFVLHHLQDLNRFTDQLYTGCTTTTDLLNFDANEEGAFLIVGIKRLGAPESTMP